MNGMAVRNRGRPVQRPLWPKPGGAEGYPWECWFREAAGKGLRLSYGREFTTAPKSLAQQLRNAAQARGLRISIKMLGDDLWVIVWRN